MAADESFVVVIPARLGSTRLPRKPLLMLAGKAMIVHVAERAIAARASQVVIATDSNEIADAVKDLDVSVCLTGENHVSGTDRIAEVAQTMNWDDRQIIVNLQGDEPCAPISGIRAVAKTLSESDADMATLATAITDYAQWHDPSCVKLVRNNEGHALYFSRAAIPFVRDHPSAAAKALPADVELLRHIGIYAYRAGFLRVFSALPSSSLERAESLEQLRALQNGYAIAVAIAPEPFPAGVDTEEDVARVTQLLVMAT